MMARRPPPVQKYQPVQARTLRDLPLHQDSDIPVQRLGGFESESPQMRDPKIKDVNPVTKGDRSTARRIYEKGRMDKSRS